MKKFLACSFEKAHFLRRYKRFLCDVILDGELITVHCTNTGAMTGLTEHERPCLISYSNNKTRRYPYTLEALWHHDRWVGANTRAPHKLWEFYADELLPPMGVSGTYTMKSEIVYKQSRIDYCVTDGDNNLHYIELKNVHHVTPYNAVHHRYPRAPYEGDAWIAQFPDSVSVRASKHMEHMIYARSEGINAHTVYIIQRDDAEALCAYEDIDPTYAQWVKKSQKKGVCLHAWTFSVAEDGIALVRKIPVLC